MKVFLTDFHYKKHFNFAEAIAAGGIYALLSIPALVYLGITKTRNYLYRRNILKSVKSKVYTISVGNLTTGGTGKTPITAEIANYLSKKGEFPAILSRGYGGKLSNKNVNVISDGKKINFEASECGDEPFWLAKNCPQTAILTCSSRVKSAEYAKKIGCTKLILDDGYQHQKLSRDLNILVVDSEKQFSNGLVLPLGALREPMEEIKRADKIVVVNKNLEDLHAKAFARYLRKKYKKPVQVCDMRPDTVYHLKTNVKLPSAKAVIAFCAIGQPEQFYNLLKEYDVLETKNFPDHHIYTKEDLKELRKMMQKHGAQALVTTEKDAVKIKEIMKEEKDPIFALKLKPILDVERLLND